jgi:dienelactone hydrolase
MFMSSISEASATPIVSIDAVLIPAPGRGQDLEVRVTAPVSGDHLPIIVFGHGFTLSSRDYAPLVDYWAARGFVVIQPTFLDSAALGIAPTDPRTPDIWRIRVSDMVAIVDNLDVVATAVPGLDGRLDRRRIVAAGHSYGATTASMLLGARVRAADGGFGESMADARFSVGLLFSITGDGDGLNEMGAQYFPFMRPDFTEMTPPALIAAGDQDQSPLGSRGPDWFTDAYTLSPENKSLLTLFGGEHGLGGINGYNDSRTTDENPARVELIQRLSTAYLRAQLHIDDDAWMVAVDQLAAEAEPQGHLESK